MYYDFAVAIPSVQGKIIAKKKGSATYILFQYGQKYNPEKKYSIPLRSSIGKAIPDQPGFMYPNEKFSGGTSGSLQKLLPEDRFVYDHQESYG